MSSVHCPLHPDREGVGICVSCRRVVCADCATRVDGINHCKSCLEKKIKTAARAPGAARRAVERVVALGGLAAAFFALTGIFYAIGLNAADIGWFGTGHTGTARALADAADGIRRFKVDTDRYPTESEGLRALLTDQPLPGAAPIARWSGPYARPHGSENAYEYQNEFEPGDETFRDGYGSPLIYVPATGRARPAVLSIGANRRRETDARSLRRGDPAAGDDRIQWVY